MFAKELGVDCEFFVIADWGQKFFELDSKNIDAIWNGMTITDEVTLNTSCSNPYVVNAQVVIMKADVVGNYTSTDSLKDLTFAVESGSAGEDAVKGLGISDYVAVQDQTKAVMEVSAGTADACVVDITLANFTVTDERKEKVDFAKPYMKVALGVVSPENAEITDVSQLKGKTLIIAKGTTAESYFEKNEPDVKLQKYDQYADAYNALLDGRGDAFSTDNTEVLAWAKINKGFKVGITKLGDEDTIAPAVQKGNKELLNWINDEIVKLGKENFFHKDYEETLKPVYGSDVNPDDIVVEGGKL